MAIKLLFGIIACCLLLISTSFGQVISKGYCKDEVGKAINFSGTHPNIVYAEYDESSETIQIKIINTTSDTVYLFKSYIDSNLVSSKYIHCVNEKDKKYYINFLPIISNLSTKKNDKLILGEDKIGSKGQILYKFVELAPNNYYVCLIRLNDLFKNQDLKHNAIYCQDYHLQDKFKPFKFKTLTTKKLKGKYDLVVTFGTYKDTSIICDASNYYTDEFEFNKSARLFNIIEMPVFIRGNKPAFLK